MAAAEVAAVNVTTPVAVRTATLAVVTYYDVEGFPRHPDIESAGQNADECYEEGENTTCRGGFSCVCCFVAFSLFSIRLLKFDPRAHEKSSIFFFDISLILVFFYMYFCMLCVYLCA